MKEVEKKLSIKIETVRKKLKADIALATKDLKIWFGGMLVITIGVLSGVITLVVYLAS